MKTQISSFEELPKAVSEILNQLGQIKYRLDSLSNEEEKPELIDIQEAAKLLQIAVPTLYNKVSKREVPHLKKGKRLLFHRSELLEYLNSGRRKTSADSDEELQVEVDDLLQKSLSRIKKHKRS